MPTYFNIPVRRPGKADLDLHCLQKLHERVQTTVYLFETSDATMQICPMTLTLYMVGTLDPLNTCARGARPTNDLRNNFSLPLNYR